MLGGRLVMDLCRASCSRRPCWISQTLGGIQAAFRRRGCGASHLSLVYRQRGIVMVSGVCPRPPVMNDNAVHCILTKAYTTAVSCRATSNVCPGCGGFLQHFLSCHLDDGGSLLETSGRHSCKKQPTQTSGTESWVGITTTN